MRHVGWAYLKTGNADDTPLLSRTRLGPEMRTGAWTETPVFISGGQPTATMLDAGHAAFMESEHMIMPGSRELPDEALSAIWTAMESWLPQPVAMADLRPMSPGDKTRDYPPARPSAVRRMTTLDEGKSQVGQGGGAS